MNSNHAEQPVLEGRAPQSWTADSSERVNKHKGNRPKANCKTEEAQIPIELMNQQSWLQLYMEHDTNGRE